ncbi:hypothetical protein ES704_00560 [subsurface metagenome]|jgi:hypothetical protein
MNKEEKSSSKCPICGRATHKELKCCIFHAKAEEKTEEEFKGALKKYIQEIKKEQKDYDFEKFIFVGNIKFNEDLNVTILKNADFNEATFKGDASFWNATFKGDASFWNATFKGKTDFWNATFKGDSVFQEAIFKGDANFEVKSFAKYVNFKKIRVLPGKKLNLKVENNKAKVNFERAYLEDAYLDISIIAGVLIDFNNALLKNTKIKKDRIINHILQEKEKKFNEAQEVYLLLKNNFHSIGQYEDESWAFTKERDMERMSKSFYSLLRKYKKYSLFKKILKQGNLLKRVIIKSKIFSKWLFSKKAIEWFNLSVSDFIYQYGENPWRVIRFALIIIFLFAIILNFSGIVNSDNTNLIIEFIKKSQGDEYTIRYLGPILGSFLNCLYFSVVTFTTLGYGDFQPAVGLSRFFVSLESIIGAITMALFVYTFARRTGGR